MDEIFLDEKEKLVKIRHIIDNRVQHLLKNNKYKDFSEYSLLNDGLSEDKIKEIKEYNQRIENEIDHIKGIYNEPYYGRMDFLVGDNKEEKTIYVGEKALIIDDEQLVYDWRTPLGNLYHTKNKFKIKVKGEEYNLTLRRILRIENGELVSYNDEYKREVFEEKKLEAIVESKSEEIEDVEEIIEVSPIEINENIGDDELEELSSLTFHEKAVLLGKSDSDAMVKIEELEDIEEIKYDGISDPFLLNLIKDKRKHKKLTNIIKTIQDNQNKIIRLKEDTNFIVQGCAGSGKTMIMLHRLSYLSYNNPDFRFDRTKIITPNKNFNLHIAELSDELEIDNINMFTVEEYYLHLLEKYRPEQWDQDSLVAREEVLGYDFISKIYSDEFIEQCESFYNEYMEELLESFNDEKISRVFTKYNIEAFEAKSPYANRRINDYKGYLESIIDGNNINKFKIAELTKEIENLEELIEDEKERMAIEEETSIYGKLKRELQGAILIEKERIEEISNSIILKDIMDKFEVEMDLNYNNFIDNYKDIIDDVNRKNRDREKSIFELLDVYEEKEKASIEKRESYRETINLYKQIENMNREKLIKLESELEEVSIFSFVRKNTLMSNIESLKEDIVRSKAYYESNISDLIALELETEKLKNDIDFKRESVLSDEEKAFLSKIEVEIKEIKDNINRNNLDLDDLEHEHRGDRSKLDIEIDRIGKMKFEYNKIQEVIIDDNDIKNLTEVILKLNNNSIEHVYEKTFKIKIDELKSKYQIPSLLGSLYRHELYLRLKFYSLYIGPIRGGDRYLNIDEGQDISVNEYRTIKEVNGEKMVLNIYGDTHQLVGNRGIEYWNSIDWIKETYILEENYRNTIEITEYCNEEFDLNISSIGISGEPVKIADEETGLELIREGLKDENERCAIIVTGILDSDFSDRCVKLGALKGRIAKGRISLLTPLEAKGVEFERVFVYDRNMTVNEKYISYTRALGELIIIR